jgi:hypothetical protein
MGTVESSAPDDTLISGTIFYQDIHLLLDKPVVYAEKIQGGENFAKALCR